MEFGFAAGQAMAGLTITAETHADAREREALLDRAMGPKRKRKSSEKLRRGRLPAEGLAFSARDGNGRLVGTVRLWNVSIAPYLPRAGTTLAATGEKAGILLLGPLAVDPALKGQGVGSVLMRHAIAEAKHLGHEAILLVGDADYYARFGFCAGKTAQLAMPGPYERERFLALELKDGALDRVQGVLVPCGRRQRRERRVRAA